MTEEQNVVNSVGEVTQDTSLPSHEAIQPTASPEVEQNHEKMVPQSKVNEIVGATKKSAYEKAYQDAKRESINYGEKVNEQLRHTGPETNVDDLVASKVSEHINQLYESQRQEEARLAAQKTLNSLQLKVEEASKKYDDFEDATKDIPYASFPDLLTATDSVDNSGDVLYHLAKNPSKFRELASSISCDNPLRAVALKELKQLSDSLKNNEIARSKDLPRQPLSQVRPSNVGMDNGKKSITDLRRKYTV